MKKIHIIPTKKPSRLHKIGNELGLTDTPNSNFLAKQQNIYITSDEEIKEENLTKSIYVIDVQNGNIGKLTCKNSFFKDSSKLIEIEWSNKQNIWNYYHIREIILTTDQDLIADGVQAIDDEFLEWFVKNPNLMLSKPVNSTRCEFVTVTNLYGDFKPVKYDYKIIIPQEETTPVWKQIIESCGGEEEFMESAGLKPKKETLEESAKKYTRGVDFGTSNDYNAFIEGAKWQQERMYSLDEIKTAMKNGYGIKYFSEHKFLENLKQLKTK
jgi:hypothetical protein